MLTMKDIIRDPDPFLRIRTKEVEEIDEETITQLKEMREYLVNSQNEETAEKYGLRPGVGLAAPQIGLDKRMLAVYIEGEEGEVVHDYMLINPKVKSHSVTETYLPNGEGCLSVDEEMPGLVHRHQRVRVSATDIHGEPIEVKAKGMLAVVLQHELDHLDGIMFYDRIDKDMPMEPKIGARPVE
ncbi:peptide deformylase [Salinicoccus hispanicus]|uniref:Peptide deformylase n=1 Tax=Salinicoccus hispanicus TaxID=157225 RepID=A0A6N8TVL7_9STAP|nr:peptide deformylase [Salinicoccus hispanicus]MXQ49740.1 peptide deformylase [Salinicoccus hispanicus]